MAQKLQHVEMWQGNDHTITFSVVDAAGAAVNITAATPISWKFGLTRTSAALVTKTLAGGGITITDGPGGKFRVTLLPADTSTQSGTFYHEAEITLAGALTTVAEGSLVIFATIH